MKAIALATLSGAVLPIGAISSEVGATDIKVGSVALQGFPKLPKIKKPKVRLPSAERTTPIGSTVPETRQEREANAELERELYATQNVLLNDFSFNWTSPADNPQVDEAAAEYRSYVDAAIDGRFNPLRQDRLDSFQNVMKLHYDNRTTERWIDRQITFAEGNRGNGAGDRTYNDLLVLEVMLYGAVNLFPENQQYAAAKAKVDAVMAKYGGSRANATKRKDTEELAKARSVRMPAAIQKSRQIEDMFRSAWGTSGIPYTIRKIHIRSGWAPKRNEFGRVIGQVRDAAIAVEDPTSGKCYLYDFTMIKDGGSVRRSSHAAKRMACENIPK
ncbi:hypothetical protein [Pontixanthobacter sp. CEM42]|uniref:hypothetical protein n=1 Tax=Pontixanthobacter sp. CEM42 TaxID=2792077 RepID=UPI001ADF1CB6|nr:hypothetical protein [Pontixanthobacter sp. CEM42]